MIKKIEKGEVRTIDQLRKDYEIEKELADRLRNSAKNERSHLYSSLYDEMFQRTPLHPQLIIKSSPQKKAIKISRIMKYLNHYLGKDTSFLEVGPGDCSLSLEVAKHVKKVFAADVSNEIVKDLPHSGNFTLILSDGCKIPLPADSIDVVFSNQLMEHLHPDDAFDQLRNIFNVLNTGGVYLCVTPNRLN